MTTRLLFRVDCDGVTGFGHFSRCLSLARALISTREAEVMFCGRFNDFAKQALHHYGIASLDAQSLGYDLPDVANTQILCQEFDVLIVDSYESTQAYVTGLAGREFRLVIMDDVHVRSKDFTGVDLVINTRAGSEMLTYPSRSVALGIEYLIIKPELKAIRVANLARSVRAIKNVLVFFSGRDTKPNVLQMVIEMTRIALPDAGISYIDSGSPIYGPDSIRQVPFRPDIENLYSAADLIVTGGGLVKYESAYCDIPNVALSQTDLQDQDTKILAARNLTYDLGMVKDFDLPVASERLKRFIHDHSALAAQHLAFRTAMHSDSTQRLASLMLSL
jgi:spore coat polysaccharide biosynthesis predicted glycosyltransferase SpsG